MSNVLHEAIVIRAQIPVYSVIQEAIVIHEQLRVSNVMQVNIVNSLVQLLVLYAHEDMLQQQAQ